VDKIGLTPLGEALIRVEAVLDMATQPDLLLDILEEIREEDTGSIRWVRGKAGACRAVRVR